MGTGPGSITVQSATLDIEVVLDGRVMIAGEPAADLTGFKNASVYAPRAVLRGNKQGNYLDVSGCDLRVHGEDGDDGMSANPTSPSDGAPKFDCEPTVRMSGGRGDDRLSGKNGRDRLAGNAGSDELYGWSNADLLLGGSGLDQLKGGGGSDAMYGNRGRDTADGGHHGQDRCEAEIQRRCEH